MPVPFERANPSVRAARQILLDRLAGDLHPDQLDPTSKCSRATTRPSRRSGRCLPGHRSSFAVPSNKALNRTANSLIQLARVLSRGILG